MASLGKPDRQHGMMAESDNSPDELYAFLCRVICGQAKRSEWGSWVENDGAWLVQRAESEGVAGLVFWLSRESGWLERIPKGVSDALRRSYFRQAAQNALLSSELERLLDAFSNAAVPVIVLKGAALAREIYPDPALRPMNDLDLLVHARDLEHTVGLLRANGYRKLKSSYHLVFQGGPQLRVTVEVHWEFIGNRFRGGKAYLEGLWERARAWREGEGTRSGLHLNPMDNLLSLSAHLIWQHPQDHARLIWFFDIYSLARRYMDEIDWEALAGLALEAGWAQPLYLALVGVEERFGWQAPGGTLQALSDGDPEARLPAPDNHERDRRLAAWTWAAMTELSWSQRIQGALALAMPHPDYMRWRYQPQAGWLLPLYYPVRWWMLLRGGLAGWMQ